MSSSQPLSVNLLALVRLFYAVPVQLGQFVEVVAEQVPEPYRGLLAHDAHMTVTVEAHHHDTVDVDVLDKNVTATHYARKIVLRRRRDRHVVQFGIMRVNYAYLDAEVRAEIQREETPLGRILINHNVLRFVQLVALWRVTAGEDLARCLDIEPGRETFGRTALIYCNGEPAVELLEIVAPE